MLMTSEKCLIHIHILPALDTLEVIELKTQTKLNLRNGNLKMEDV